ncbi:MAG: hypothetical protein VW405_11410 [Rhodospirillaceae bacterium]
MGNAFDSANYPETEPEELVIGDRWLWKRTDLPVDYPTADYALSYTADKQGAGSTSFSITASETGGVYVVEVASATTAGYNVGTYAWQAYITRTSDSQRVSVARGTWNVIANLSASTADPRSHVKKVLDAIEAVLESRATVDQMAYTIQGRSLSRTPIPDLLKMRDTYKAEYAAEINAERRRHGKPARNRLLARL